MKYPRLLLLLTILPSLLFSSQASETPNIVIIYADDLGYGDVQFYNPERGKIPTPHIDRMAREGMRFTDAHSSSGVCSPSLQWAQGAPLWGKPYPKPGALQ